MVLTRNFKETIQARIERDPTFREELLKEGGECLLSGDMDTSKLALQRLARVQKVHGREDTETS